MLASSVNKLPKLKTINEVASLIKNKAAVKPPSQLVLKLMNENKFKFIFGYISEKTKINDKFKNTILVVPAIKPTSVVNTKPKK